MKMKLPGFKRISMYSAVSTLALTLSLSSAHAEETKKEFNISAQPLAKALLEYSRQSDATVVVPDALVVGKDGRAVSGSMTPVAALALMLEGSGLKMKSTEDGGYTLVKAADKADESEIAKEPELVEELVVTGTRLKGHNPASPVITLDRQKLEQGGYSSLEDVFRRLPQNLSSITSESVDLGQGEFGAFGGSPVSPVGASSINLRGLGSRATLVLINGRRKATSAQSSGGFTDISSIPLSQVERVEILTDGASAIYGADAVAGVVNIILRKDYEGAVLQARHEKSSSGGDISRLNGTYTFHWDSGFATISADVAENKPADINSFIHVGPSGVGDFSDRGGINARRRGIGQPGVVYEPLFTIDASSPFEAYLASIVPAFYEVGLIPEGQDGTALDEADLLSGMSGDRSVYERFNIGPETESKSIRLAGEQDFTNGMVFSFDVGLTTQENAENWQPDVFAFNFLTYERLAYIPESNPYNNFNRDVLVGYSFKNEFSQMELSNKQEQDSLQTSMGLQGDLPFASGWTFNLDYAYSKEKGQSVYLSDLTGTFGFGDDAAELRVFPVLNQLNVFGDGTDPAIVAHNVELLSSLVEQFTNDFDSDVHSFEATVNGDWFSLPAGEVSVVAGMQLRKEEHGNVPGFEGLLAQATERDVKAFFGEMRVPLLIDKSWAEELVMTLAVRHESIDQQGQSRYDNGVSTATPGIDLEELLGVPVGAPYVAQPATTLKRSFSSTDPQVTLSWKPMSDLRLRATWGESFLTPQPSQQFGTSRSMNGASYYALQGGVVPDGVNSIVRLMGPNPDLEPQNAETLTYGFDWTPSMLPELELGVTYSRTEFENYIGTPGFGADFGFLSQHIDSLPDVFRVSGDVMVLDTRQINFSGRKSETIDFRASYELDTDFGAWQLAFNAVRNLELSHRVIDESPKIELADSEYGVSRWAGNLSLNWAYGDYSVTAVAHHTSSHKVIDPASASATIYNDFIPNANPRRTSPSYTTVDLQVGYQSPALSGLMSGVKMQLGARNLFKPDFPFVDNSVGYIANRVSSRGRVVYFDITKSFDF